MPEAPDATGVAASQAVRYGCAVNVELFCPAEVAVNKAGFFALGNSAFIAGAIAGRLMGVQHAKAKARKLARPQWRQYTQAQATLTDDRVILAFEGQRYDLAYSTVRNWKATQQGLEIERVKFDPVRLRASDHDTLVQWFARLAEGHTWQPPVAEQLTAEREVAQWCQQDPRFTFGVPPGWEWPGQAWMAMMGQRTPGRPIAALTTGYTDVYWNALVVELMRDEYLNPEFVEEAADEVAAQIAGDMRGSVVGPIRILSLGGERTIAMRVSGPPDDKRDVTYMFLTHNGAFFLVMYAVVGSVATDGDYYICLPDVNTMLATWHWYE
jgi:hypothetical protein